MVTNQAGHRGSARNGQPDSNATLSNYEEELVEVDNSEILTKVQVAIQDIVIG